MRIKFLGTRGEIKISDWRHHKHSGILIDKKILIDMGEKEYLNDKPKIILITHLHPDHAFFVSGKEEINIHLPIYGPEPSSKPGTIKPLTKPFLFDGYKIIPIPVVHSLKVKSQGYVIEKEKERLFCSGDIVGINKKYFPKLHNLNAVITEASFIRRGGVIRKNIGGSLSGHAGIPDLIELFKKFTSRIILTHFGTWFVKDVEAGRRKIRSLEQTGFRIDLAFDGSEFFI